MKKNYLIEYRSEKIRYGNIVIDNPFRTCVPEGVTVVYGGNGSGKTTFGIATEKGRHAFGNIISSGRESLKVKMITFTDIHSLTGIDVEYYSQRMEATANEFVPTVGDIFGKRMADARWKKMEDMFCLSDISEKKVNFLSSGELRKLLLANALLSDPDLLILDSPYIGLDADSRNELDKALRELKEEGTGIMLLLCDPEEIPDYTDTLIPIDKCVIGKAISGEVEIGNFKSSCKVTDESVKLPSREGGLGNYTISFSIKGGHARYGDKEIFSGLDWEVKRGESWLLTGRNGSGKSLLLSMVCADNPQGYSNRITLFDRRRGSGESIWEIKDNIGYVCPEMQLYFRSPHPVTDIIVQGLRNSLNRYRPITDDERQLAAQWLQLIGISHLSDRHFNQLSSGEQRLVLLARAFIRQPELLVLDEPFQGLDLIYKERIRNIIDTMVGRNGTSLILVTHYPQEAPECVTKRKDMSV